MAKITRSQSFQMDSKSNIKVDIAEIARLKMNKSALSSYENDLNLDVIEDESDLEVFEILNGGEDNELFFYYDGNESVVNKNKISVFEFHSHDECHFEKNFTLEDNK